MYRATMFMALMLAAAGCGGTPVAPDVQIQQGRPSGTPTSQATISGWVYAAMPNGEPPVSNAAIDVTESVGTPRTEHADEDGAYRVSVSPGDVTITVSKDGFESKSVRLTVRQDTVLNFSLTPQ